MGAHGIIYVPAGIDDPRVVSQFVGFPRQVIRVNANAVSAHQSRREFEEIPFRSRCLQHFIRVDADAIEYDAELVDERNIDIALRILDDFGSFCYFDA